MTGFNVEHEMSEPTFEQEKDANDISHVEAIIGADMELDEKDPNYMERLEYLNFQYTQKEERRVLLKLDIVVLGYVSGAYLLAYMDRGNIGNANTAGMSKSLGISDSQYQWLLTVLYLGYILFDWQTIFYKILPARYYVPTVIIIWGIIAGACAAAQNFAGMLVLRLLLGIFESSYSPGLAYFFSFFYLRQETAKRLGWYVSIAPLAASFAGAFAYFVTIQHHSIEGWRVLFLVEGLPAIAVGALGYFILPSNAADCQFLTERQRKIAIARTIKQTGETERDRKIHVKELLRSLVDLRNWLPTLMYFSYNVSYSSLPVYVPTILTGMGFTALKAQGLSAPPYLFAAIVVVIVAYLSDRFKKRGIFLAMCSGTSAIGYLILALVHSVAVKYFALFLVAGGMYPCIALILSWVSNNNGTDSKRGAGFILMNFVGQCGPLLGTRLFPASDGPYYQKGFFISFAFCVFATVLAFLQILWLRHLNRNLDAQYGPAEGHILNAEDNINVEGDSNRNFRYVY